KDHADALAQLDQIAVARMNVHAVEQDVPGMANPVDEIVHPVECAQKGALTAPGRADQRHDGAFGHIHRNRVQSLLRAVPKREIGHLEFDLLGGAAERFPAILGPLGNDGRIPKRRHSETSGKGSPFCTVSLRYYAGLESDEM